MPETRPLSTDTRSAPWVSFGYLLLAVAVLSVGLNELTGSWPAGHGGVVAAAFALVGSAIVASSLAVRITGEEDSRLPI